MNKNCESCTNIYQKLQLGTTKTALLCSSCKVLLLQNYAPQAVIKDAIKLPIPKHLNVVLDDNLHFSFSSLLKKKDNRSTIGFVIIGLCILIEIIAGIYFSQYGDLSKVSITHVFLIGFGQLILFIYAIYLLYKVINNTSSQTNLILSKQKLIVKYRPHYFQFSNTINQEFVLDEISDVLFRPYDKMDEKGDFWEKRYAIELIMTDKQQIAIIKNIKKEMLAQFISQVLDWFKGTV